MVGYVKECIFACVSRSARRNAIYNGMTRSNQNLLVLSIFLAACIIIFVHVFIFPIYNTEPKNKKHKLFGEYEPHMCSSYVKPTKMPMLFKYHCPKDGIVLVAQGGRLGNQMWEYASAWAVARRTGLEPYVPHCIRKVLDDVFEDLTIPPLGYISHCPMKMDNTVRSLELWTHTSQSIFLRRFSVLPELVLSWVDDIRHEFKFKKRFADTSQKILATASKLISNTTTTIYVCIHVRRTDYKDYLWRTHRILLAGADYFHRAMNYFRYKFKKNVAFLVVSDDPGWCRQNLVHDHNDVFVVSKSGAAANAGQDLAIMAACNHSIIDYGTFGVWGAILASGETILYNISKHSSVRVSELLPNWHLMN